MLAAHDGPIGLASMFGPGSGSFGGKWWNSGVMGVNRKRISGFAANPGVGRAVAPIQRCVEHDQNMALSGRARAAYGLHLAEERPAW